MDKVQPVLKGKAPEKGLNLGGTASPPVLLIGASYQICYFSKTYKIYSPLGVGGLLWTSFHNCLWRSSNKDSLLYWIPFYITSLLKLSQVSFPGWEKCNRVTFQGALQTAHRTCRASPERAQDRLCNS